MVTCGLISHRSHIFPIRDRSLWVFLVTPLQSANTYYKAILSDLRYMWWCKRCFILLFHFTEIHVWNDSRCYCHVAMSVWCRGLALHIFSKPAAKYCYNLIYADSSEAIYLDTTRTLFHICSIICQVPETDFNVFSCWISPLNVWPHQNLPLHWTGGLIRWWRWSPDVLDLASLVR